MTSILLSVSNQIKPAWITTKAMYGIEVYYSKPQ